MRDPRNIAGEPGARLKPRPFRARRTLAACAGGVLAAAGLAGLLADDADPSRLAPEQLLERVASVYARCASYRDSGVATTVFIERFFRRTVEKPFRTAFVRPDRFRYEYYDKSNGWDRYVIWRGGKEIRTRWTVDPGEKTARSLEDALAAATGVSGGSSRRIPGLLLAEPICAGWDIRRLKRLERLPDARLRGADFLVLRGETGIERSSPVVLWIGRASLLIRRIDAGDQFDDFRTEDTTTYEPFVNADVPDGLLQFDQPAWDAAAGLPAIGRASGARAGRGGA